MLGWWDIISSFISELRQIQLIGSFLNRGLSKYLIILHFLDTCVKEHSLIKKKCNNMSPLLSFPKLKKYIVSCFVRQQKQEACNIEELWVLYLCSQCSSYPSVQPASHSAASDQAKVKPVQAEQITPVCPSVWLSEETWKWGAATQNCSPQNNSQDNVVRIKCTWKRKKRFKDITFCFFRGSNYKTGWHASSSASLSTSASLNAGLDRWVTVILLFGTLEGTDQQSIPRLALSPGLSFPPVHYLVSALR